ncbi:MAG TPA: hypothetical protein VMT94_00740, partial [Burkholderiales bacterium]|nr:hypothetical protein [Burkholderiales bacterium]
EAVLEELRRRGLLDETRRLSQTAQALTLTPRDAADLFVRHLHPEMWIFEVDNPAVVPYVPVHWIYWRVPGERGMLLHTFFSIPMLMDYAVAPADHADCLDQSILEYIYYSRNFADSKIHVVQDSDEFGIVSLTPTAVNWSPPQTKESRSPFARWMQRYDRLCNVRESMWHFAGRNRDTMRRDLFGMPIRLHRGELDEVWAEAERRSNRMIRLAVGDYYRVSKPPYTKRFPPKYGFNPRIVFGLTPTVRGVVKLRLLDPCSRRLHDVVSVARVIGRRVGLGLCGDSVALRWWSWRLRKLGSTLFRQPFHEPRPPAP